MSFSDESFDVVLSSAVLHFARDEAQFHAMLREMWRVLRPGGFFFARLASSIGIEQRIRPLGNRRYRLPDGSDRFLVDEEMLLSLTADARRLARRSDQDHQRAEPAMHDDVVLVQGVSNECQPKPYALGLARMRPRVATTWRRMLSKSSGRLFGCTEPWRSRMVSPRKFRSSSCVMKSSRVPNFSTSFWSRRLRMASGSSVSGISAVVFMPPSLGGSGFQIKGRLNPSIPEPQPTVLHELTALKGRKHTAWRRKKTDIHTLREP